ncbi:hypothetical protein IFM89_004914 [Coptis chinensis]|uniref:cysteine dioxygenase n=1 Tax=Coptis chinensis TaxID=261450 RepID=A0A835LQD9_9MAGN|nr:hypothetical protein IFM89_004914 [Coptis chinensis]
MRLDNNNFDNKQQVKKKNRKRSNSSTMPTVVQKLFRTCRDVFANCEAGTVPPNADVERLRLVLEKEREGVKKAGGKGGYHTLVCERRQRWKGKREERKKKHKLQVQVPGSEGRKNAITNDEGCDSESYFYLSWSECSTFVYILSCLQAYKHDVYCVDGMKPADVGLTQDMPYFRTIETEGSPPITYLHLYECNKFSIGIFCLPPNGVIPLHNHPGMTVFIKPPGVQLAKVKVDSVLTAPCSTSILYPADGGNMHCFTAVTSCAVLDVLGPPYSDPEGRHCTYYLDFPYSSFSDDAGAVAENERESYAWLEEKEKPDDFNVVGAMYRGPKIVK